MNCSYVVGCDVGRQYTKTVVLKNGEILSHGIRKTGFNPKKAAEKNRDTVLSKADLSPSDVDYCISTGNSKEQIQFADKSIPIIKCFVEGTSSMISTVGSIVDVGGLSSKAARMGKDGQVSDYAFNDKCAGGSGKFFEVLAEALEVELDDLGELFQKSNDPVNVSSQCVVFGESEIIAHLNEGEKLEDIVAGVCNSIANRVKGLVNRVGIKEDIVVVGGVAKNDGFVKSLEEDLGVKVYRPSVDPQIIGALGASLLAEEVLKDEDI